VMLQVGSVSESIDVSASRRATSNRSLGGLAGGVSRKMAPLPPPPPPSPARSSGFGGGSYRVAEAAARAQQLGDLFEYKLKEPITIRKNQSALVPIVQSNVEAEKVSIWNANAGLPKPQRALWLKNTSGLTLDGGSFTVLEDESFAGEGLLEPLRPDEKRLVSYATDLALTVTAKQESAALRVSRVKVANGVMVHFREMREKKSYTFRNQDATARDVLVEHPVRQGFELRSDTRPVETTAQWMRFRLPVAPKQTATLLVEEGRAAETTYSIGMIKPEMVDAFVKESSIDKPLEEALRKVVAQKRVVSELEDQKAKLDAEVESIGEDQERLRENMKALKGSAEEKSLLQRYTKQLNAQENRIDALRTETAAMEQKVTAAEADLEKLIAALSFDRTL